MVVNNDSEFLSHFRRLKYLVLCVLELCKGYLRSRYIQKSRVGRSSVQLLTGFLRETISLNKIDASKLTIHKELTEISTSVRIAVNCDKCGTG